MIEFIKNMIVGSLAISAFIFLIYLFKTFTVVFVSTIGICLFIGFAYNIGKEIRHPTPYESVI